MRKWFLKLTLQTKWIIPSDRALKPVSENGVESCVHFCLRSLVPFERCSPKKEILRQWLDLKIKLKCPKPAARYKSPIPIMGKYCTPPKPIPNHSDKLY